MSKIDEDDEVCLLRDMLLTANFALMALRHGLRISKKKQYIEAGEVVGALESELLSIVKTIYEYAGKERSPATPAPCAPLIPFPGNRKSKTKSPKKSKT
jgi:hypothetical protein